MLNFNLRSHSKLNLSSTHHVDRGSDGQDKSGYLWVDSVLLLEAVHGHGEGGGAGGRPPGRGQRPQHVPDEPVIDRLLGSLQTE